jgi:hypothetical protein
VWLCSSDLKGETESLIVTVQDQAHNTRYHQWNNMKQPTDIKFIMYCKAKTHQNILLLDAQHLRHLITLIETIKRLVTSTGRYVNVRMGLQVTDRYCEHIPDRVINVNGTAGMWDVAVITDRTVRTSKPT